MQERMSNVCRETKIPGNNQGNARNHKHSNRKRRLPFTGSSLEVVDAQSQMIWQMVLVFIKGGKYRWKNQVRAKIMFSIFYVREVISKVGDHEC